MARAQLSRGHSSTSPPALHPLCPTPSPCARQPLAQARPAPPSHTSPALTCPQPHRAPFTAPSQTPPGSCCPCPAQPWLCSPFCPFAGIPLPQATMGSPTFPSSSALPGATTADPRVPLNQATTQSPLLCSHVHQHPLRAHGEPWGSPGSLPRPSAGPGCPGAGRDWAHSDITTPRSRSGPGGNPPRLQTGLAHILRPSGNNNTGLIPAWVDSGKS